MARQTEELKRFLQVKPPAGPGDPGLSLFSGAGISDIGYELAGFRFCVQVELDAQRAAVGKGNFPGSSWLVKDAGEARRDVVREYIAKTDLRPALLAATPPCQGMSSSNPSRGKRKSGEAGQYEAKNALLLDVAPIALALQPRLIVCENVRQVRTHMVTNGDHERRLLATLADELPGYKLFDTSVNMADYGVPQIRHRALVVLVHRDEPCLAGLERQGRMPWPKQTHSRYPRAGRKRWVSIRRWFRAMAYPPLSSRTAEEARDSHPLHFVPHYGTDRYLLVRDIPPHTGRSAYENSICPSCWYHPVPVGAAVCSACGEAMRNRPIVLDPSGARLIKGFSSSYRRMRSDMPAPTVTTNSSHIGSDNKIHPWEHRVLSILECADLQTVPRFFDWSAALEKGQAYLVRNLIGEALPSYFTYLHGRILRRLLAGDDSVYGELAVSG